MEFIDNSHDRDSSLDTWQKFYVKVYPDFFGQYFDFSKIDDKETSPKCKRWYIKLKDDIVQKKAFPNFKMSGDCIFNFNSQKVDIFKKYVKTEEELRLLEYCANHHHSFENFAFMPITGGMNNQKGRNKLDRPDVHVKNIYNYFKDNNRNIFSNAQGNEKALEWYLSLFDRNINKYIEKVYLIYDKDFIENKFLPFSEKKICNEETAKEYMLLAKNFWKKRDIKVNE